MVKKEMLLGNFINRNKILSYLEYIHNTYGIKYDNLFVYEITDNDEEYFVTFKINEKQRSLVNDIKGGTILHYKKGCLFSINALNKLIEKENPNVIDKTKYEVSWDNYSGKIILVNKNEIHIQAINKIEDKCIFFI